MIQNEKLAPRAWEVFDEGLGGWVVRADRGSAAKAKPLYDEATVRALSAQVEELRADAERWRALMSSQKMHWMGSAGFEHRAKSESVKGSRLLEDQIAVPKPGEVWHFGMEFWFGIEADPRYPDTFERRLMVDYADAIRALQPKAGQGKAGK